MVKTFAPLLKRHIAYLVTQKNKSRYWRRVAIDNSKEKEIAVWLRLQDSLDKPQLIESAIQAFHLSESDALRLYNETFPDGLSAEEDRLIQAIDTTAATDTAVTASFLKDYMSYIAGELEGTDKFIACNVRQETLDVLSPIIRDLLESKNLI